MQYATKCSVVDGKTMSEDRVLILDTTLRDGLQAPGAYMSPNDQLNIAHYLDNTGVDIIEAGYPALCENNKLRVQKISQVVKKSIVCALAGSAKCEILSAHIAMRRAKKRRIHTFISTSDEYLESKLGINREIALERIATSVTFARSLVDDVQWSAEDAIRTSPDFLVSAVQTAVDCGANTINLADTVGCATPTEVTRTIRMLKARISGNDRLKISAHCHNDLGLATANSLAAIEAGARQIECTINGLGERTGNTSLAEIVAAIHVRKDVAPYRTKVATESMHFLSNLASKAVGTPIPANKPIVGRNAFSLKSVLDSNERKMLQRHFIAESDFSSNSADAQSDRFSGDGLTQLGINLSPRQLEIARLLCSGFRYKKIAQIIGISDSTVAFHVHEIKKKLNLKSTNEMIFNLSKSSLISNF